MISKLKKVTIKNLFGDRDVSIDIKDNKLILIADNGSGKTTILKMIYLFLSEQWLKLSQNEFEEMMVLIDDNEIVFNRENFLTVKLSETDKEDLKRIFSYPQCEEALNEIYKYSLDSLTFDIIKNILKNYDALENLAGYILKGIEIRLGRNANLTKFSFPPILYMPTYRRIEKELSTLDVTISKSMNFRNEQYLEFFEFGSDDIQLRIFELLLTYGEEGSQQYTEQHSIFWSKTNYFFFLLSLFF